jgi:hypothetical protein
MRIRSLLGIVLFASLAAACGGGGGDDDDDTTPPDASGGDDPDANTNPGTCLTVADYANPTLIGQAATGGPVGSEATPDGITLQAALNADATPDLLQVEFIKGFGVFTTNITTGTFALSGDELNYATCGLCPRVFTDLNTTTGEPAAQQYFATAGSFTITAITPNITGTYTGLQFEEVTIADDGSFTSTPVPGGCTTNVGSGSFDVAITYQ